MNWTSLDEAKRLLTRAADKLDEAKEEMPDDARDALDLMSRTAGNHAQRLDSIRDWHHEIDPHKKKALADRIAEWRTAK
jgi:hypothetical protein